jgi:RNase P subunit RPR2
MSIKTQSIIGIMRKEGRIPEETSLVLAASKEGKDLHCMTCGKFLKVRLQHRIAAIVQDDMSYVLNSPPITIQCQTCGHIYRLNVL